MKTQETIARLEKAREHYRARIDQMRRDRSPQWMIDDWQGSLRLIEAELALLKASLPVAA